MIAGEKGEIELRGFPTGDVYGVLQELVSQTVATGAVHVVVTVTGVRYDVWGTPRPVSAKRTAIDVERARLWVAPPKRARRRPRTPPTPALVTSAPAAPGEAA